MIEINDKKTALEILRGLLNRADKDEVGVLVTESFKTQEIEEDYTLVEGQLKILDYGAEYNFSLKFKIPLEN